MKMQWFALLNILLIGLCQAGRLDEDHTRLQILKRSVRQVSDVSLKKLLNLALETIIHNCKENGYSDIEEQLTELYNEKNNCVREKSIHDLNKKDYLDHMEKCMNNFTEAAKSCLPDEKKYYPQFIHEISMSTGSFAYDDHGNLTTCLFRIINHQDAKQSLIDCLVAAGEKVKDSIEIPASQTVFCEKLETVAVCLPKTISNFCEDNEGNRNFRGSIYQATVGPCNSASSYYYYNSSSSDSSSYFTSSFSSSSFSFLTHKSFGMFFLTVVLSILPYFLVH